MAKSTSCFHLMLFLSAAAIFVAASAVLASEDIELAPAAAFPTGSESIDVPDDDESAYPPEPEMPEEIKFLQECASKVTPECGKEVFKSMFEELSVSEECCGELVAMGESCHIGLTKAILSIPEYKANASYAISRSKQTWNKCALVVGAHAPSPIPFET